jgi:hypothetical protein
MGPSEGLQIAQQSGLSHRPDGVERFGDAALRWCSTADELDAIRMPGVELAIWSRALPLCLLSWLEQLPAAHLPDFRLLVSPVHFPVASKSLLGGLDRADRKMAEILAGDMALLVDRFAELSATDLVDVRVERITTDACWRFHRDCVDLRLLVTYRGPATQWVDPSHAEEALALQERYDGPLGQAALGSVSLFKGCYGSDGEGVVHRSPPIHGTGKVRLLMCLNTPSRVSPPEWKP